MLHTSLRAAVDKRRRAVTDGIDTGFTLIELLVVVIIIGILSAIAIPVFLNQRQGAMDATVQSDLKNMATAAESQFQKSLKYPLALKTFSSSSDPAGPTVSKDNSFQVYTNPDGPDAGYILVGRNAGSGAVYVLSSYSNGAPQAEAVWTAGEAGDATQFATFAEAFAAVDSKIAAAGIDQSTYGKREAGKMGTMITIGDPTPDDTASRVA